MVSSSDNAAIMLHLRSINDLFQAPELDALAGIFVEESGVDLVLARLRSGSTPMPNRLDIVIPAAQISPGLDTQVVTALHGYTAARIENLEREANAIRNLGLRELSFGLLFLAGCLLVAGVIQAWGAGWTFVREFLVEGLVIIGWIALWHPVDMLLFSRWPAIRDRRLPTYLQQMTIRIFPAS